MRAVLPSLGLALWGLFALLGVQGPFSSLEQELYYRWLPICMAGAALVLILLRNARYAVVVQCVSLLMLLALLPYLLFAGGGM